jgi:hypothetical protein
MPQPLAVERQVMPADCVRDFLTVTTGGGGGVGRVAARFLAYAAPSRLDPGF